MPTMVYRISHYVIPAVLLLLFATAECAETEKPADEDVITIRGYGVPTTASGADALAELRVLEREQNWSRVEIDSNRRGWVDAKSILELHDIPQNILGKK